MSVRITHKEHLDILATKFRAAALWFLSMATNTEDPAGAKHLTVASGVALDKWLALCAELQNYEIARKARMARVGLEDQPEIGAK